MTPVAKRRMKWLAATIVLVGTCRLALPIPLHGNWVSRLTFHLCDDQAFCRFVDGRVTFYHEHNNPKPDGTYAKVGWHSYRWDSNHNGGKPITVHSGWLFVRYEGVGTNGTIWGFRDLRLRSDARIVRMNDAMPPMEKTKTGAQ